MLKLSSKLGRNIRVALVGGHSGVACVGYRDRVLRVGGRGGVSQVKFVVILMVQ